MFKVTNPGGVGILVCIFPLPFLSFLCLLSELHSFKKIEAQINIAKIGLLCPKGLGAVNYLLF